MDTWSCIYFGKPRARLLILCLYFYLPSDRYKIPDEQNATLDSEGKKSRPITTTFNKTPGEREKETLKTYQIIPQGNISFSTALCLKYLWIAGICFLVILKMYFFSSWFGGEADGWQQAGTICGTFVQHKPGLNFFVLFVFLCFATNCYKNVVNLAFRDKNIVNLAFRNKNGTI